MEKCISKVKAYAMSERSLLITGEPGTEKRFLAECIHNLSSRSEGPFEIFSCTGLEGDVQKNTLFGMEGLAISMDRGTLLIEDADELTRDNQRRLFELIKYKRFRIKDENIQHISDVRILCSSEKSLMREYEQGNVISDLYYLLCGFEIHIPALRERRDDLKSIIERYFKKYCQYYGRYHVLTEGGISELLNFYWNGNILQVDSICEYLILNAKRRSLDEIDVKVALRNMSEDNGGGNSIFVQNEMTDTMEQRIKAALDASRGKKIEAAKILGISKSTLWRYMKKYEIR